MIWVITDSIFDPEIGMLGDVFQSRLHLRILVRISVQDPKHFLVLELILADWGFELGGYIRHSL